PTCPTRRSSDLDESNENHKLRSLARTFRSHARLPAVLEVRNGHIRIIGLRPRAQAAVRSEAHRPRVVFRDPSCLIKRCARWRVEGISADQSAPQEGKSVL